MTNNNNPVLVTYTDCELHNLVEEYITQQKSGFTLKGVCSYVLYWAVEDDKVARGHSLIESNAINSKDQERVIRVLNAIIADGRIASKGLEEYKKTIVLTRKL